MIPLRARNELRADYLPAEAPLDMPVQTLRGQPLNGDLIASASEGCQPR